MQLGLLPVLFSPKPSVTNIACRNESQSCEPKRVQAAKPSVSAEGLGSPLDEAERKGEKLRCQLQSASNKEAMRSRGWPGTEEKEKYSSARFASRNFEVRKPSPATAPAPPESVAAQLQTPLALKAKKQCWFGPFTTDVKLRRSNPNDRRPWIEREKAGSFILRSDSRAKGLNAGWREAIHRATPEGGQQALRMQTPTYVLPVLLAVTAGPSSRSVSRSLVKLSKSS